METDHEVVMSSTTEPESEIAEALGTEAKKPDGTPSDATGGTEDAGPPKEDEPKPEVVAKPHADEGGNKKWRKRVDTLTRRNAELEERLRALEDRPREPEVTPRKEQTAQPKGKPSPEQFVTYEDYVEALADFKAGERIERIENERRQREITDHHNSALKAYGKQVREARIAHKDFDDVVGRSDAQIPRASQLAIIESPVGAEIAYYLGSNPDVCEELQGMSPARAAAHIGKIEALLSVDQPRDKAAAATESKAPAPVKTVTGKAVKTQVEPGDLSYQEYRRLRDNGSLR